MSRNRTAPVYRDIAVSSVLFSLPLLGVRHEGAARRPLCGGYPRNCDLNPVSFNALHLPWNTYTN
ncbi:protein of unknown function [Paraburkholderia kururiensis]